MPQVRWTPLLVNVAVRAALVLLVVMVLTAPADDPRFEDKGIGTRAIMVVTAMGLLVPGWWAVRGRPWSRFPLWADALFLSIPLFDLGGNVLDLYESVGFFDLLTHGHGTAAGTVVAAELLGLPGLSAVGIGQVAHILLEAQEYYGDIAFGLENVHGPGDIIDDLLAGLAGTALYMAIYTWRSRAGVMSRTRSGPPKPADDPTT